MTTLFAITLFWSAALLFWVEPMVGKLVLPQLGGAPAVWNTCMVFFQAMLLAGYAAAHWLSGCLSSRAQRATHIALLLVALATLPIRLNESAATPWQHWPTAWLLLQLLVNVGPAFFVLALTTPLLQRWFAASASMGARDPYFLYAASNLGSFAALLGYPLFIELNFPLREQAWLWAAAFLVMPVLALACGAKSARAGDLQPPSPSPVGRDSVEPSDSSAASISLPATATERLAALAPTASADGVRRSPTLPNDSVGKWGSTESHPTGTALARRLHWGVCAAVPSSLLLGVTTYITTDIASMPLLWVLPLALYLLTFVFVFARRQLFSPRLLSRALPIGALALAYQMCAGLSEPAWLVLGIHLVVFFIAAMVCHARLAADRPEPQRLTEFYLWMSLGGVLGDLFNTLLAPLLFNSVVEYPLALMAACWLRWEAKTPVGRDSVEPSNERSEASISPPGTATEMLAALAPTASANGVRRSLTLPDDGVSAPDLLWPLGLAVLTGLLAALLPPAKLLAPQIQSLVIFGLPLLLCFLLVDSPRRFALGLGALFFGGAFFTGGFGKTLHVERNFFGVTRVTLSPNGDARQIVHGRTIHGRQFLDLARAAEPLTFYHREGPLGEVFKVFAARAGDHMSPIRSVGVIGLGAGSMAAYARAGERWTFYDIDPSVLRIAQDTNFFTFLERSAATETRLIEGDARLRLREAADGCYDLLVLDAFSSDAIPVHLITREAVELYLRKLAPGGMLAFHISNRYLDLEPVLANLAEDLWLAALGCDDMSLTSAEFATGREQAHWVVMARAADGLADFQRRIRWSPLEGNPRVGVWTDDFSSPLRVIQR
ncbi:MAG: fused MFS/spermidine synthase [Verrucomicrobia bacterium]|nr:fused MFS/spermidine synthase [Verrucomicrobiota bacterium]